MSFTFEDPVEKEVAHPELVNTYKINGQEVMVITGKDPKCPTGYKIIKTNINEQESDTKVIICSKGTVNTLELPSLALSPIPSVLDEQRFPFAIRDDAFNNLDEDEDKDIYNNCHLSMELWVILIIFIIALIYLNNLKKINSDDIDINDT